ncbi:MULTISPECIES: DUF3054 domain-containing protein [unclassified Agromyces]|uniref:DUF3054 domain-containing protein n=1 Tax=unclassified Agromyces TaxID=2639701 RepID=UPI003015216D
MPSNRPSAAVVAIAAAVDALLVVAFAVAGRSSHAEGLDLSGVWRTAWPFLAGGAVGWVAALGWRRPFAAWPTGVAAWLGAVVIGMVLRTATGQGTAMPFIVVATLSLAVLIVGWRAALALVTRRRALRLVR